MNKKTISIVAGIITLLSCVAINNLKALEQNSPERVIFTDFSLFTPAGAVTDYQCKDKWWHRKNVVFAKKGGNLLHVATGFPPDITYDPKLKGRYDLYVGLHRVGKDARFQIHITGDDKWYTFGVGDLANGLFAKNIKMDGKSITLHYYGDERVYLDYLCFVKSKKSTEVINKFVIRESRKSFKEITLVQKSYMPKGFTKLDYIDDKPLPKSSSGKDPKYIIFAKTYMDLVFPATIPAKDEINPVLKAFGSWGEYEPLTFSVRALENLKNVKVSVTDLVDRRKKRIAKNDVEVRVVRCMNKRDGYYKSKKYLYSPVFLEKRQKIDINKNTTKQFWLTIKVPEDIGYGEYSGKVIFAPENAPAKEIPIQFTVFPFKLKEPTDRVIAMWDCCMQNLQGESNYLEKKFQDMRNHGMTSVTWWFGNADFKYKLKNGNIQVIFDGHSNLEKIMKAYKTAGFPCPFGWLISRDFENRIMKIGACKIGSKHFADYYGSIIKQILAEGKKRNWPEIIFGVRDEITSHYLAKKDYKHITEFLHLTKIVKEAGGKVWASQLPFNGATPEKDALIKANLSNIDYVSVFSDLSSKEKRLKTTEAIAKAKELGIDMYMYNFVLPTTTSMSGYRFSTGLFLLTAYGDAYNGMSHLHYNKPMGKSSYNNLDCHMDDAIAVYPPCKYSNEVGGPTLGWEAIREGRDDIKYAYTLSLYIKNALAQHSPEMLTVRERGREAQKRLDKILGAIKIDKKLLNNPYKVFAGEWEDEGYSSVEGKYNLKNGLSLEDYDKNRRIMAEEILALHGMISLDNKE